jgi:acyl carrier protein
VIFIESDKNQPAQDFVQRTLEAFRSEPSANGTRLYRLTLEQLEATWQAAQRHTDTSPSSRDAETAPHNSRQQPIGNGRQQTPAMWQWELCQHIASDWSSVDGVLRKIRAEARPRPELDDSYSPPRTAVEQQVVELCQAVLNVEGVGIHDGLKELGASSLHIVQIYSRLEQAFQAGLSITDLFALPTVSAIIDKIERRSRATASGSQAVEATSQSAEPTSTQYAGHSTAGIAVIGMAGRFPGASSVGEFWSNITAGVCSIVEIPDEALNLPSDSPLRANPNLVRMAASVQDADKFDAKFFGIFPKEATLMDPQHRLLLENCWHAIEDAGYNVDALEVPVGVFAGCYMDTYMLASLALSPSGSRVWPMPSTGAIC